MPSQSSLTTSSMSQQRDESDPAEVVCTQPAQRQRVALSAAVMLAQVTAFFFVVFILDGIITENVFELLAAIVLDALVLARVLFYVIAKKNKHFRGRLAILGCITGFQVIVLVRSGAQSPNVTFLPHRPRCKQGGCRSTALDDVSAGSHPLNSQTSFSVIWDGSPGLRALRTR